MSLIGDRPMGLFEWVLRKAVPTSCWTTFPLDQQEEMLNGATVLKKKGQKKVASSSMQLNGTIRCNTGLFLNSPYRILVSEKRQHINFAFDR